MKMNNVEIATMLRMTVKIIHRMFRNTTKKERLI